MKQEKSKLQLFIQGSFVLVISNVCIKAVNFFLLPLYTKDLTPSMMGVSDSITTFMDVLIPVLTMGLDSAYSAFYFDKEDPDRDKKVYSTISIVSFFIGIIPVLMCAAAAFITKLLFHSDQYRLEVMIALLGVTLTLWYRPFSLEVRLKNKMTLYGIASFMASLSMVVLNIIFVSFLKLGTMSLILSIAIVAGISLLLFTLFAGSVPSWRYFDRFLLKKMLIFALPLVPLVLMNWVLSLSDRYILLYYHGEDSVGIYGIGVRFVTILNVIVSAVSTAYTTFAFSSKDDEDAKRNYYSIFNVVSIVLLCICFTVAVFSREIISIMADKAYAGSYVTIRDLMYGQALYAMSTIVSYGIIFKKKSVYLLIATSAGAVLNLVCNFVFIPQYGLVAAAVTTMAGYLLNLGVVYYYSECLYPCDYGMKRVAGITTATYFVAYFIRDAGVMTKIVIWLLVIGICAVIYRDIIRSISSLFLKTVKSR